MVFNKNLLKKKWFPNVITGCLIALFYLIISHFGLVLAGIREIWTYVAPVFWGWVIAYVLDPFVKLVENRVFYRLKTERLRRNLSVVSVAIIMVGLIALLMATLIPQLVESVVYLIRHLNGYARSFDKVANSFIDRFRWMPFNRPEIVNSADTVIQKIVTWINGNSGKILDTSFDIGGHFVNGAIGIILAVYFLLYKPRIMEGMSRFFRAVLKERRFRIVSAYLRRCHEILIRFISVDLLDGLIVGAANWIFMKILGMPYAILISMVVGVTNLAPTFGPIIGALMGSFILVLIDPWKALYFLIFTAILQTIDGYVLKPKLFGDQLGVSPVLILVSITIGSKMFGVTGILLAIPCAAIFDFTYRDLILPRLERKRESIPVIAGSEEEEPDH